MRPTSREIARMRVADVLIDEAMRPNIDGDNYTKIKRLRAVREKWTDYLFESVGISYWRYL